MSKIEKINDLVDLLKTGVINQEEFGSLKNEIIYTNEDIEKRTVLSEPHTKQEEIPKQRPIATNINKPAQKLKWYERPWPVALLIIFFFPLGLLLMWVNKVWNVGTRLIITGLFVLAIIGNASNTESSGAGTYNMWPYKCTLYRDGTCVVWQEDRVYGESKNPYCRTEGRYIKKDGYIIFNGFYNSNCPYVGRDLNGKKYEIDGTRLVGPR